MSNRYTNHLEKRANLLLGAALTHLGQNVGTKLALSNKKIGKYVGHAFNQGVHGLVDKSKIGYVKRVATGTVIPDIGVMQSKLHDLGKTMAPHLQEMSLKQRAVLHHVVSKGSFPKKYEHMVSDERVKKIYDVARGHAKVKMGLDLPELSDIASKKGNVQDLWKDKKHPLLSNIMKNVGSGKATAAKFKPGNLGPKEGLLGSAMAGSVDPAAGAIDGLKAAMSSKKFTSSKIGGAVSRKLEDMFVKTPIRKGHMNPDNVGSKLKNMAGDIIVNPLSGSLKRTSAALTNAVKKEQV